MKWLIYKHTNKINGKVYVGQTCKAVNRRWNDGKGYKRSTYFYNAIQKYGWDNFIHEIIEDNIDSVELANEREHFWIEFYNSANPNFGYNLTSGGGNHIVSHIGRQHMSEAQKIAQANPEILTKMIEARQKVFDTDEYKQKASIVHKAIYERPGQREKASLAQKEVMSRPGQRELTSITTKAAMQNPALRQLMSNKKKEWHKAHPMYNQRKILCITTGVIFTSIAETARAYNLHVSNIIRCCKGDAKQTGGYQFKYLDNKGDTKND